MGPAQDLGELVGAGDHGRRVQATGLTGDALDRAPEMETAATTRPDGPRTGADTEATPNSRSLTLWAQPRRRTPDKVVAVNFAPWSPRCIRSGSSQASRT